MNAPETRIEIPTIPGTPFAGGFYMGRFYVGAIAYALIVSPKAEGEHAAAAWHTRKKSVAGAVSVSDGRANTAAMAEAGSELAQWAQALQVGGLTDWYLPSRIESLILHAAEAEAEAFQEDGAEALERDWYWTSTQHASAASYAWYQGFYYGLQYYYHKPYELRARAVRRLEI